jgi:hypothetical protein
MNNRRGQIAKMFLIKYKCSNKMIEQHFDFF